MRRIALSAALFLSLRPGLAPAEEWTLLDTAGVETALTDRKVVYDSGAWQEFRASGRTLYNAGEDSWGYWGVRDGRYCSMWPPSDLWACYDLQYDGARIRFVGEAGDITIGTYAD